MRYPKQHLTYAACRKLLGNKDKKKIANNTYLISTPGFPGEKEPAYFVQLHGKDIALFRSNGMVGINLCGYNTLTTRRRLNDFVACGFSSKKFVPHFQNKPIKSNGWETIVYG